MIDLYRNMFNCSLKSKKITQPEKINLNFLLFESFEEIYEYLNIIIMHYLKDLFVKGKYFWYTGFAILIESQRNTLVTKTKLYDNIRKKAIEELKFSDPQNDHKDLVLQTLSEQDQNKLKSLTKKQILEIQNLSKLSGSTTAITASVLGLGAFNYFVSPTSAAIFLSSYLTLLSLDFIKSMAVIRFGIQPWWNWKMQDVGYVMAFSFSFVTMIVAGRSAIAKLKERASRAVIVKDMPQNKN